MKKDTDRTEKSLVMQSEKNEYTELYKKAFLLDDTGESNEYCLNTTAWD